MRCSNCGIRLSVAALFFLPACLLAADQTDTSAQVTQLLETGWKNSAGSYPVAQEQYEQAKQAAPSDARVPFAMALVAIKRYRLDEASKYIDEALASEKPLLPIRRVRFWLDLQRKDQAAQKADVRKLTSILASNSALAERADYQETARWLGVALGYYSEPGKSHLPAADREALDAEVSGQLNGAWAKSLTDGRNSVGVQFKKLQADLADARKQVKAKNEAKRAEDRQKNDTDLQDCNEKMRTANLDVVRIKNDKDNSPVLAEYSQLQTDWNYVQTHRPSPPPTFRDEDAKDRGIKQDYDDEIDKINRRLRAIEARVNALYPQLQKIQTQLAPFLAILREQETRLQSLQKQQKHLTLPVMENDDATQALDAAANSFTTYGGINLEQEKKRILESYKTK